jgi:signal transduction histidine kinase
LPAAEAASRAARRPALAQVDLAHGRYWLVIASQPASYAMQIGVAALANPAGWPLDEDAPVRVTLDHAGQAAVLHAGQPRDGGFRFTFRKPLSAASQPFDVVVERQGGWDDLPLAAIGAWAAACAALVFAVATVVRQRRERQRAERLLRLGQIARLDTLGELAGGMAHELNQPLTAVLADSQAAARLLHDSPPDVDGARAAMSHAVQQARRAADVVARLRRALARPDAGSRVPVRLDEAVRAALFLLEHECRRRGVTPDLDALGGHIVLADPVALEQIVHNLVMNALQSLERVPVAQRRLRIVTGGAHAKAWLAVIDTGAGIPREDLPRVFDPFFTTRPQGLGLGLSLCQTLAARMQGDIAVEPVSPHGAQFRLELPAATSATGRSDDEYRSRAAEADR